MEGIKNRILSNSPNPLAIRACLDRVDRPIRLMPGLIHFFLPFVFWILSLVGILFAPFWAQIVLGIMNGNAIAAMFNIGHSALHGSLFPKTWMNRVAGLIAMAPALKPVTSWIHVHNYLHHSFTNIKEKDASFAPLSPTEYNILSPIGKFSYRICRSWYGCGWLYLKEMWFKWEFFPSPQRTPKDSKAFLIDRIQLALFVSFWFSLLVWFSVARGENILIMLITGFVLPQFISCYFIGFVTFLQHTHPKVAWYSELDSQIPTFHESQMRSTPHLVFPRVLRILMRNIMEHTAHHVDTALPFLKLPDAQNALEDSFKNYIVRERWSFLHFVQNTRICKLYDYTKHQWVGYDGEPLAEPISL